MRNRHWGGLWETVLKKLGDLGYRIGEIVTAFDTIERRWTRIVENGEDVADVWQRKSLVVTLGRGTTVGR